MRIVSVNSSLGKTVEWKGRTVQTGIFKARVQGPAMIRKLNLEGDRPSDLTVHGGVDKAIYSYDWEDYAWWIRTLGRNLDPGAFGENLTTEGVLDREISAGDVLRFGSAILQAVQPRLPCYKLSVKFDDDQMTKRFMQAERWGIYYRVLEEGTVKAGDTIEFVAKDPNRVRIADLPRMMAGDMVDEDLLRRAMAVEAIPVSWKEIIVDMAEREGIKR